MSIADAPSGSVCEMSLRRPVTGLLATAVGGAVLVVSLSRSEWSTGDLLCDPDKFRDGGAYRIVDLGPSRFRRRAERDRVRSAVFGCAYTGIPTH
jgi:hypothetical protein